MLRFQRKTVLLFISLLCCSTIVFAASQLPRLRWPAKSSIESIGFSEFPTKSQLAVKVDKAPVALPGAISKTSKTVNLPNGITGLHSRGDIHFIIVVRPGPNELKVKGDAASVSAVRYKVDKGSLQLYFENKNKDFFKKVFHQKKHKLIAYLKLNRLTRIQQYGASTIKLTYHNSQVVSIHKRGSGSLVVKGNAVQLFRLENDGSGPITINRVYSNNLTVIDNGSGDVKLLGSRVNLRELTTDNSGNLSINNIRSQHLILNVDTDGVINLTGEAEISTIHFEGSGNLKLYWVKSHDLTITTHGSGTLALAGAANIVNAYAHDRSHLNLRYLRAKDVFVITYRLADADVWAQDNLYALAENNSNIYYYSQPKYMSRMMRQSGSILPMSDIHGAILGFNIKGSIS